MNKWQLGKYPGIPYISLQIAIGVWNRGKCAEAISRKDSRNYKIEIKTPGRGPNFLFVTRGRFGRKSVKIKTRALNPANISFGGGRGIDGSHHYATDGRKLIHDTTGHPRGAPQAVPNSCTMAIKSPNKLSCEVRPQFTPLSTKKGRRSLEIRQNRSSRRQKSPHRRIHFGAQSSIRQ